MPNRERKAEIIPIETEAKISVKDLSVVRQRILELGGSHREEGEGVFFQRNTFWDTETGRLSGADQLLRVRVVRANSEEGELKKVTVTWKGPRQQDNGVFKSRPEIEIEVFDPQAAIQLLNALGFTEKIEVFEKMIEHFELDRVAFDLNQIPFLGTFVELEGPKEMIKAVVARLNLKSEILPFAKATSRRYEELLEKYLEEGRLPLDLKHNFTFEAAAQLERDQTKEK